MSAKAVRVLQMMREPIADYQEARGCDKTEVYSFVSLITALCQHAYNAALTIVTMFIHLMPLFDGFTYFLRFVLDRLIEILESETLQDKIIKSLIFTGQLIVLFILIFFIVTLLLMPIVALVYHFVAKVFSVARK